MIRYFVVDKEQYSALVQTKDSTPYEAISNRTNAFVLKDVFESVFPERDYCIVQETDQFTRITDFTHDIRHRQGEQGGW